MGCDIHRKSIYTPGWRETTESKVSCLRKQHDIAETILTSNHRPSDFPTESPIGSPTPWNDSNLANFHVARNVINVMVYIFLDVIVLSKVRLSLFSSCGRETIKGRYSSKLQNKALASFCLSVNWMDVLNSTFRSCGFFSIIFVFSSS